MEPSKELYFSVDSALLSELGERLVSTVYVALAELVKNSYDADATTVSITIKPTTVGGPHIVVRDDGSGMSPYDVSKLWMKIGTTNKVDAPVSAKYGRPKTGSKGIGRFVCRRLGRHLKLETCALVHPTDHTGGYARTVMEFVWDNFVAGTDVESIPCKAIVENLKSHKSGTLLEIWAATADEWQARGFDYLQRQLVVLASNKGARRSGFVEDPGFSVLLEAPGLSSTAVDLRAAVIDASWGTLSGFVDKEGRAHLSLNAKGLGGTKTLVSAVKFEGISGASLRLGILPFTKDEARRPELLANYVVTDLVQQWGGVQVRHNGFRVYPYGDPGDDWLHIDADRGRRLGRPSDTDLFDFAASLDGIDPGRTLLTMLGMRNYLGHVDLDSAMPRLTPRIDRQGFVDTGVFEEVGLFARFAIDWANILRDNYIRARESAAATSAVDAIRPILNLDGPKERIVPMAANFLRQEIKRLTDKLPVGEQEETKNTLLRTVKAIEAVHQDSNKQLQYLRRVVSASTLTLLFAHEVRTVVGALGATSARLTQLAEAIPKYRNDLGTLAEQLTETQGRFDSLVQMTGVVGSSKSSDRLITLHLKSAIERAIGCFALVLQNYRIEVDARQVADDISVGPMIEGELYTVLLNLLSNAVKSVIAHGTANKNICFVARRSGPAVVLEVMDNGLGLAEQFFDDVFAPFMTDPSGELYDRLEERANPEDASVLGLGSGLGLSIARDIARSRRGDIRFVIPEPPWRACIQVELP